MVGLLRQMGNGFAGAFNQPASLLLDEHKSGNRVAAGGRGRFDLGHRFHQGKTFADQSQVVYVDLELAGLLVGGKCLLELLFNTLAAIGPGAARTDELAGFRPAGRQPFGVALIEAGFQLGQDGKDGLSRRIAGRFLRGLFLGQNRRGDGNQQDREKSSNQALHANDSMNWG